MKTTFLVPMVVGLGALAWVGSGIWRQPNSVNHRNATAAASSVPSNKATPEPQSPKHPIIQFYLEHGDYPNVNGASSDGYEGQWVPGMGPKSVLNMSFKEGSYTATFTYAGPQQGNDAYEVELTRPEEGKMITTKKLVHYNGAGTEVWTHGEYHAGMRPTPPRPAQ